MVYNRAMTVSTLRAGAIDLEKPLVYGIWTGLLLLLLMPLVVSTDTLFPFIVGKALHARAMIELMVGLWLVLAYFYPAYRPRRSLILTAFVVYLAIAFLSGLLGVSPQRSLWSTYERMQGIVDLAHWFLLAVVLTAVLRSRNHWTALLNLNLGVSLVIALIGVAQHFGKSVPVYSFIEATPRVDITLGNPTYVGTFMMVNILIGLALLTRSIMQRPPRFLVNVLGGRGLIDPSSQVPSEAVASPARERRRQRRLRRRVQQQTTDYPLLLWRLFWISVVLIDLVILWWSGSRGAFTGLGVGLAGFAVAYVLWGRARVVRRAALWLLGALALVVILIVIAGKFDSVAESNVMVRQFSDIGLDNGSIKGRIESLSAGLEGFADRPILGWGPENYSIAWARNFDAESGVRETFDQAHNKPVEELTTKGLFGFLSYMAVWVAMLAVLGRRAKTADAGQQIFLLFVGAALTGYFVQNLFLFDTPATILQFVLLLGLVASLETRSEESTSERVQPKPQRPPETAADAKASPAWYSPLAARLKTALTSQSQTVSPYLLGGMLAVVLVLVSVGVYFLNYRPYIAARVVVRTADPSLSWDERFALFERSVGSFGPLANYPRLIMFGLLTSNWGTLSRPEEVDAALATLEREGARALDAEPEGWRINVALAQVYQSASFGDPELLSQARSYVDRATTLAPETLEVTALRQRQRLVERQLGSTQSEKDE